MTELRFELHDGAGTVQRNIEIRQLVIAGWTGRDAAAVRHHIDELAAIGVPPPSSVPVYYRVASSLLTQQVALEALGTGSSGEAEPVLLAADDGLWLTLGSDHTDRDAERAGVALSKQLCPKPVALRAWRWDSVAAHADALELRSWIREAGQRVPYQDGTLAALRALPELALGWSPGGLAPGTAMFCGTLAAIGGVRPSSDFEAELRDPVTGRAIALSYTTQALPIVS